MIERDGWLLPVEKELTARHESYLRALREIEKSAGSIVDYANGYRYFGWQRDETLEGWWFREWLPGRRTFICWATSTVGSALRCGSTETRKGVEYFPARCDVCRTAHARLALQAPRPWRQRLAGPHSGLRDARGTGRKPRISPPSSGIRPRSTGRVTGPLRPAARNYSSTKPT